MNKDKVYNYSVRTKDAKLHQFVLDKVKELDCSICDYLKQLLIKEYKKETK